MRHYCIMLLKLEKLISMLTILEPTYTRSVLGLMGVFSLFLES